MNTKQELRKKILKQRKETPKDVLDQKSQKILERLWSSQKYQRAKRIFTYINMPKEVNTIRLMERAWKEEKEVFVPISKDGGIMYFVSVGSHDELYRTDFGVLEPRKKSQEQQFPDKEDLFLVPGAVFDRRGNRIGYGGGYYDRYMAMGRGYAKIGLAFSFQVMEFQIPTERFDIVVDEIITEEEWIIGGDHID